MMAMTRAAMAIARVFMPDSFPAENRLKQPER